MCLPSEKIPVSDHSTVANQEGYCDVGESFSYIFLFIFFKKVTQIFSLNVVEE